METLHRVQADWVPANKNTNVNALDTQEHELFMGWIFLYDGSLGIYIVA